MSQAQSIRTPSKSRAFWQSHYQQWQRSGLRKIDYCRDQGLNAGTFYNWCHTFSSAPCTAVDHLPADHNPLQLIPITLEHSAGDSKDTVSISCAAFTLTLPVDLGAEQINIWLSTVADLHA